MISELPIIDKTVLIACDKNAEWLLPWFFHYYNQHNNIPVTVADLGISELGLNFVKKHTDRVFSKICNDKLGIFCYPITSVQSNAAYAWKPVSIYCCPAKKILWLDLDCQVVGDISDLLSGTVGFGVAKDTLFHNTNFVDDMKRKKYNFYNCEIYNAGVIACEQKHWILEKWCNLLNVAPIGWRNDDQSLLSLLLDSLSTEDFVELDEIWNCLSPYSIAKTIPNARIYHRLTSHPFTSEVIKKEIEERGLRL